MTNFGVQEFCSGWAEIVTAIATLGLFVATAILAYAAIRGASIAIAQLKSLERTERIKNTFQMVRAYFTGTPEMPSPAIAYTRLDKLPYTDPNEAGPILGQSLAEYVAQVSDLFILLQNYFDEADDLIQRGLLDSDLFLSRQSQVIKQSAAMLLRYQALVPPQYVNSALIARMEAMSKQYALDHPTLK